MTNTHKRPLVTRTGLITAGIAFSFPLLADRVIVSAMSEAAEVGLGSVLGMAAYTAAPFLLLDSAMRPRRRVRLALWMGLALTAIVWIAFARTGHAFQSFSNEGNAVFQGCKETAKDMFAAVFSGTAEDRAGLEPAAKDCVAAYDKPGSAHVGVFMITMLWPAVVIGIMGAAAKIGEKPYDA